MEEFLSWIQTITFWEVVTIWIPSSVIIFGGVVPFIPQYREIRRKGDAEGFSLYVCLVLLVSNILRVLFWCVVKFEKPLLFQSMFMNIAMLFMIHVCVTVKNKNQIIRGPERLFTDFDWRQFWQWTDFTSYIEFLVSLTLVFSLVTFVLQDSWFYVQTLGFVALLTEAMLAVPQLLKNYRNKSTEGMSVLMVLMWLLGDCFKTIYFLFRGTPPQFWVCGCLQIGIDIFILGQVYCCKVDVFLPFVERVLYKIRKLKSKKVIKF